jgi:hypothetical protein
MKHLQRFFFLYLYISLLSGCSNTPPTKNEVEQINTVPSSTLARTATPKYTPTPGLPGATPTITATPAPPLIPTLGSHKNSSAYQLTQPSPEGLLGLIDIINTQYKYVNGHSEEYPNFDFMLDELANLLAVIDAEIKLYYPDGFPNPEIIWNYYPFTSQEVYPVFPSAYLDALTDAIFDDLSGRPGDLKDQGAMDGNEYTVKIYQIELDYDPGPEWLVRMDWKKITALSWLVLDQNSKGTYTRLRQSLPDIPLISPISQVTIEALQDFTGDGLTDIIFLDAGYSGGTYSHKFHVAQGTENGFRELPSINKGVSLTLLGTSDYYEIGIPSGSTWLNLTVSDPHNLNWGCAWTTKTSYRWSYGREQIFVSGEETPKTPECSLAHAVSLLDPVNDTIAVRLLENAIHQFDQNDIDQHGKLLFAHYRLAILYAELNQSLARQHLEWVIQNSTESEQDLQQKLSLLLEEESINPIRLCEVVYRSADSELPGGWKNYLGAAAAIQTFPGSTEIYPPAICPLQDIIRDQLRKVNLSTQPVSEKALADQGIPVIAIQAYPVPKQKYPASFMLLGETTLYVVGYVPTLQGWQWRFMEEFEPLNGLPQTFFKDVTGDGFPELAYSQEDRNWYCAEHENEQGYKIFLTTYSDIGFVSLLHYVCHAVNETFDITNYLPDENKDGVVDWVIDQIRASGGDSFPSAERVEPGTWFTPDEIRSLIPEENNIVGDQADVISRLYEGGRSAIIRRRFIRERDNLKPADVWADREWQRLTYLIAVSYEIEGQTDKAVETFVSVLQSENQTLWGNLAALHLVTK